MKKMKPWMWIALAVGGLLILRRTGFALVALVAACGGQPEIVL